MYIKQTLLGFFPHSSVPQKVPFNRLIHLQPSTFCLATIRELLLQRNPQGKEFFPQSLDKETFTDWFVPRQYKFWVVIMETGSGWKIKALQETLGRGKKFHHFDLRWRFKSQDNKNAVQLNITQIYMKNELALRQYHSYFILTCVFFKYITTVYRPVSHFNCI